MNLRQLQYFVAIADAGSFTRAAKQLLVAQPSLSQQVKALETELGGPLLERLPKGIRLTAAGGAFLTEARATVTHAERAQRAARGALGLEAGELEVATVTSVAFGILPPAFERWHARFPAITLALREYSHRTALDDAVRLGVGDIAVGPHPPNWDGVVLHLGWEEFVIVLPPNDPLAKSDRPLALASLSDRNWVLFGPNHGLTELALHVCASAGFAPRRTVQTGQVAAASHLAAAGLGVTLVPENVVPTGLKAEVRRLKPPVVRQLAAFARQEWSPLADKFLGVLREQRWKARPKVAMTIE